MPEGTDPVVVLAWTGDETGTGNIPGIPAADLTDYDMHHLTMRDPRWNAGAGAPPFTQRVSRVIDAEEERAGGEIVKFKQTVDAFEPMTEREIHDATAQLTQELIDSGKYAAVTRSGEPKSRRDSKDAARVADRVADVPTSEE
jgi:hypothetical protein